MTGCRRVLCGLHSPKRASRPRHRSARVSRAGWDASGFPAANEARRFATRMPEACAIVVRIPRQGGMKTACRAWPARRTTSA